MGRDQYKLLIGGVGDDAHSIGIGLIDLGFREEGFFVKNIGIRNKIDSFFELADKYDIILISNKNGHAELYLSDFPRLLSQLKVTEAGPKLWYLGGSLSVSESDFAIKKMFLSMGFTNVYPKPIVFSEVLSDITADIHRYGIRKRYVLSENSAINAKIPAGAYDLIKDRRWTQKELFDQRKEVLMEWPTGQDVLHNPTERLFKNATVGELLKWRAGRRFSPLLQPRTGVADIEQQIELLKYLETQGSDISSVQLDAASRSRSYAMATLGKDISLERKRSALNGFPIPIYGVSEVRRLVSSLKTPFQVRGGGPDHRFTYEIALKAGVSAIEGGPICYLLPYDKLCTPCESLNNWQYVDRLCSHYEEEQGLLVNREYFGVLTAALIEPSLAIVVNIVQSLLSAQQGVKSITIGYAEQGNRSQDIAAVWAMQEMVLQYLQKFKYYQCNVTTVFHQYMAAFPSDYEKARDLIFHSSVTATLAGATKVMVKTAVEAISIPDKYENAKALKLCRMGALSATISQLEHDQITIELRLIRKQVRQIMNAILDLGNNSIAIGMVKAIECGVIDIPWSPNVYNNNKVLNIRDIDGAIRFIKFGNLPFDSEVKEFHLEKTRVRMMMERDPRVFSLLEKDLSRIWKNDYIKWPLDKSYVI